MPERILITGGAGFIGTHITRLLLGQGRTVRVIDSLIDQVHTPGAPLDPIFDHVEFYRGDIRDRDTVARALRGVDKVVHLAAEVGVGQSMYLIDRYVSVNDHGSAVLMQALLDRPAARLVVASSMSIYGEGLYTTPDGRFIDDAIRSPDRDRGWDPRGPGGEKLTPLPTPESKRPSLASVYAITKFVQERLSLTVTQAYGMEAVALRLFNVYGAGQALSNPYTGVLAIFAARLLNGQRPIIFEDGAQRRDFVHVEDVARAFVLALDHPDASGGVFNIASGRSVCIAELAEQFASAMGRPDLTPELTHQARVGDIRHCFADISHAAARLGYVAERSFSDSFPELVDWVSRQKAVDRVADARRELETRGLVA